MNLMSFAVISVFLSLIAMILTYCSGYLVILSVSAGLLKILGDLVKCAVSARVLYCALVN